MRHIQRWALGLFNNVAGNLGAAVVLAGIGTIWAVVKDAPPWIVPILALWLLAGTLVLFRQVKGIVGLPETPRTTTPQPSAQVAIIGQTFHNQHVDIDGRAFTNCTFRNVTLVYKAIAPYSFLACAFEGSVGLRLPPNALGAVALLKALGWLTEEGARLVNLPQVIPFHRSVPSPPGDAEPPKEGRPS
jgi:hypothetical protein